MDGLTTLTELEQEISQPRRNAIDKVRYSHVAMADLIIQNPWISQNDLAAHFGYTAGWVSQVLASDSFQEHIAKRRAEIVDPDIKATIEERFRALVIQSYAVLKKKLENSPSDDLALGVLNGASRAMGYGARGPSGGGTNVQFVVNLPAKAESSEAWEAEFHRVKEAKDGNASSDSSGT